MCIFRTMEILIMKLQGVAKNNGDTNGYGEKRRKKKEKEIREALL